jgi:GMP synthase (glutamine-hydrolysing)
MPPRVLIADNAVHRLLFRPASHWAAHLKGIKTRTVNVPAGAQIPPLEEFTHLILTGSEASILRHEPWFDIEAAFVREAVDRAIPILGSCFGQQMLVYALSGLEYLHAAETPEVGWAQVEMIGSDPLLDDLPDPWDTFVFHFDHAIDPPPPWRKLGRTRDCDTQVLRYGDHAVWGIQAHPEISRREARLSLLVALLFGLRPARQILRALRTVPPRNDVARTIVKRFLAT